jgi:VWFA-related protein
MRVSLGPSVLLAASLVGATSLVRAQPPPSEQAPPQPMFRAGTELVRVDVTVTDRDGRPVTDLGPEDFLVFEDDQPQQIQSFQLLQRDGSGSPEDNEPLEIRSREHARAVAAREAVRLFAIFFDDYHVSRGRSTLVVREALLDWVRRDLGPTDLVVLMDPLTPLDALTFTRDRYTLIQAIQAFEGRRGIYVPARSLLEEQQQLSRDVRRVRMEVTLSALEALVTHLGSLREGRKSVLFVSEGFDVPPDLLDQVRRVYDAANRGNTAIYPLDPRGLTTGPASPWLDVLRVLAANTGGRALVGFNALAEPLRQMVRDATALYLLGYVSSQAPTDGKFHKIDVRVRRKGLEVRARRGYWAPSLADLTRVRTDAAREAPPELTAALADLAVPRDGQRVATWVGVARGEAGQMRVTVAWALPRAAAARADQAEGVTVRATGSNRQTLFDARRGIVDGHHARTAPGAAPAGHVAFDAPAGPLSLLLAVDGPDGPLDTATREVVVADLWRAPVAIATPRLFRVRSAGELHQLLADPDPTPLAERTFERADRLIVALTVYSASSEPVELAAALLGRLGSPLARLPLAPARLAGATHQLDLPLHNVAPGVYVIRFDARAGTHTAAAHVALRVR